MNTMQLVLDRKELLPTFRRQRVETMAPTTDADFYREEENLADSAARVPMWLAPQRNVRGRDTRETKMNAFRAFKRIDDVSKRVLWDLDRLRGAILQANFRVDQSFTLPAMQDRRQSLSESVHDYLQCNVEMSLQDEGTIYEEMALKAQRSRGAVACYLKDLMVMLHQAEILGRIHWVSNDACVFDWHQYLVEKSQIGRTTKTLSDRWRHETTYTASMIHELHRHEVLDAECRPLGLMRGMPTRVQRLVAELQQIPWLAPQIHIIDGYEIVHQTLSEVVAEKTWSQVTDEMKPLPPPRRFQEFKPDPAIVFGSYVLTGWEVGGL